jgi:kynurenine formamidase
MGSMDEFRAAARRVSNWGRWGDADELGTLNHITPEKVAQAASLVRRGKVFPLGIPFDDRGPQGMVALRTNPIHLMTVDGGDSFEFSRRVQGMHTASSEIVAEIYDAGMFRFNDDYITMPTQAATQWDALAHVYYEGQLYNGFPSDSVTSLGAAHCGIGPVDAKGIVSRGVLLDVAGHRGLAYIDPGLDAITPGELDDVARAQGVTVEPGDVVLVRTGWWGEFDRTRDRSLGWNGLSWRCAEWLADLSVAAVAADNVAVEGSTQDTALFNPLHMLCLRDMGMMLGEIWDLEALAADCREDGVYEVQLVAPPLRITGAVGSPVNPIAVK